MNKSDIETSVIEIDSHFIRRDNLIKFKLIVKNSNKDTMKVRPDDSERSRDKSVGDRSSSERVSVYVRLRPYTEDEYIKDRQTCIESFDQEEKTIVSMIFIFIFSRHIDLSHQLKGTSSGKYLHLII